MKSFKRYSWFLFIWIFLVIAAGGIVRMTQSGMGCPDWPRCFGFWIPPTHESQLPADFEKYLGKQDIDHSFNVYHTWIEYINRLFGALLGIFIFPYVIWSFRKFWNRDRIIPLISVLLLLFTGLIGFTGKLVVDSNLEEFSVTIHMLLAIIIAALPLHIIDRISNNKVVVKEFGILLPILFMMIVIGQIIIGTQVREEIDVISKSLNYGQRALWIDRLGSIFNIHRSFSWVVLFVSGMMYYKTRNNSEVKYYTILILAFVLLEILLGIVLGYFNIPAPAQVLHLLTACGLIMSSYYFFIKGKFN